MGWYDDLQARVDAAGSQALQSINTYLIGAGTKELVKVAGTSQGGNLTAAQIAAGQFGGTMAQAAPQSTLSQNQNAISASQIMPAIKNNMLLIAGAAVLGYVLLSKRSRR